MLESTFWLLLAAIIPSWVMEAEQQLLSRWASRGYTGSAQDIRYLGILESSFGKESEKWLEIAKEVTLHDAVFFLPGRKLPNDLKGWLYKNGHLLGTKPQLIHAVVDQWADLSSDARKQIADASQLSAHHIRLLVSYGQQVVGLKGKKLASALDAFTPSEAYPTLGTFGRMVEKAYGPNCPEAERWYQRWQASLSVPESVAFPVDREWKQGAYTLRFVPRSNPERLFAGSLTNCCQHPQGVSRGPDVAWYCQEAPNTGLLALYREGQMVAMSLVWHPVGRRRFVCLDNIEALSKEHGDRLKSFIDEKFAIELQWAVITAGKNNNDLSESVECAPEDVQIMVPKEMVYSDARRQYLIYQKNERFTPAVINPMLTAGVRGFTPPCVRPASQIKLGQAIWNTLKMSAEQARADGWFIEHIDYPGRNSVTFYKSDPVAFTRWLDKPMFEVCCNNRELGYWTGCNITDRANVLYGVRAALNSISYYYTQSFSDAECELLCSKILEKSDALWIVPDMIKATSSGCIGAFVKSSLAFEISVKGDIFDANEDEDFEFI